MGRKGSLPLSAEQVKERIFDPWGLPNNDFPIKQKQFCVNATNYQLDCQDFSREIESVGYVCVCVCVCVCIKRERERWREMREFGGPGSHSHGMWKRREASIKSAGQASRLETQGSVDVPFKSKAAWRQNSLCSQDLSLLLLSPSTDGMRQPPLRGRSTLLKIY